MPKPLSYPRVQHRSGGRAGALAASVIATACAAERVPAPHPALEAAPGPAAADIEAAPVAATPAERATPTPLPIELEPVAPARAASSELRLEIRSPSLGQHLDADRLHDALVRVGVSGAAAKYRLEVKLDGYAPREVAPAGSIALTQLVPEEATLEPGLHSLHAFVVDERGVSLKPAAEHAPAPYAIVQFSVGQTEQATSTVSEPGIAYLRPRGTYNGDTAADAALLDFYLFNTQLGADGHRVRLRIASDDRSKTFVISEWRAQRIAGLVSGDYRVELTLLDAAGRAVEEPVFRTITVNRDAPGDGAR